MSKKQQPILVLGGGGGGSSDALKVGPALGDVGFGAQAVSDSDLIAGSGITSMGGLAAPPPGTTVGDLARVTAANGVVTLYGVNYPSGTQITLWWNGVGWNFASALYTPTAQGAALVRCDITPSAGFFALPFANSIGTTTNWTFSEFGLNLISNTTAENIRSDLSVNAHSGVPGGFSIAKNGSNQAVLSYNDNGIVKNLILGTLA